MAAKRKRVITASEGFPKRDCNKLFAQAMTVQCAQACIPCAYKICCFDVALDRDFTRKVPNQRPEQCPRASSNNVVKGALGYQSGMKVLTVGDGDFSFSLALARLLQGNVVATSYESIETLEAVYPNFQETIWELDKLGARVLYQVDGTRLDETFTQERFHRIVWNFPCTAIGYGQDGQNDAMEQNKDLVRKFVANAGPLLVHNGEIHICHKTKPPFNQWKLEEVALEFCPSMKYCGKVVLDRSTLSPYTPRKALDRKSFPCHDACLFIFCTSDASACDRNEESSFPNTLPDEKAEEVDDTVEMQKPSLVPVTKELITRIREEHLAKATTPARKSKSSRKKRKR